MDVIVEDLTLHYGDNAAVRDLTLKVGAGESLVLLGPSGCGKTSTMRCVAGLEEPTAGRITIGGTTVYETGRRPVPPHKRNIGMVFQSYAVWPHRTVGQNVAFPLTMQRKSRPEIRAAVAEVLELVGLADLVDQNASQLSGGQMQRVALARSLAMRPSLLLLDEPLSNLDARLRDRLRLELRALQQQLGLTCIYVTHDQSEAIALADRIAIMRHGRVVQLGSPEEIYDRPATAEIADFIGVSNILDCHRVDDGAVTLPGTTVALAAERVPPAGALKLCVRPEDIQLRTATDADSAADTLLARVEVAVFQGDSARFRVTLDGGATLDVTAPKAQLRTLTRGSTVAVSVPRESVLVLPAEDQE
ncbi:ABC transporter ATP-binding protein [Nocardioides sp. cx-173]|uniref:ABC transporter ATP-binding protein n=1 Tax=Nocardioides sp. cx-173 TaxID=2898796 RepID=UPI001E5621AB|nr:ABC transporter ATP-binding protein [Nocardioides sp. cx-173]MCD4525262.1 ABC transporter ATP-binding protein [Nocardioides sp. cx-173]UGB40936.1 ABC transporter ATP-binding protein [Nocardioides sp. cx-173]